MIISIQAFSAYLVNVKQTIIQPNGAVIHCYASGDEFHNWLHDRQNYTIVKHPSTGYYVYATLLNGSIAPTVFVVGQADPAALGLQVGVNISPENWRAKRQEIENNTPSKSSLKAGGAQNTGTLNNLVVYIRFAGESEYTDQTSVYSNMFNNTTSGYSSMYNYFKEVSYNTLFMPSTFYPTPSTSTVISFQDLFSRNYYKEYDAITNTNGYNGTTERRDREHTLLKNAVNAIKSQISTSLNIDYDNDGYVDNICFIIKGVKAGASFYGLTVGHYSAKRLL